MKKLLLLFAVFISSHGFTQIWQNDFSNPSDWISSDLNAGTDTWIISSTAIGGDVDSISSSSAANNFAQFNSDGQCNGNHQDVTLTYFQPIDISANQLSYLEFVQHYKRKSDTVYVEFSNDGLTWESVRINKNYWYYQQTENPDTVQVSIPSTIQTQPFYLRFRFQGECGFAWLMDDLMIFEREQYAAHAIGQINSKGLGYVQIASCYTNSLDGFFELTNFGYDTLFNVTIHSTVYSDGLPVDTQTDVVPQINPLATTTFEQVELIQGPLIMYANYLIVTKIYNLDFDTLIVSDSVSITHSESYRYDGAIEGHLPLSSINYQMAVGNIFIPTEPMCVMETSLYIPDTSEFENAIIYATVFRKNGPVWTFVNMTADEFVLITDLGGWKTLAFEYSGQDLLFLPGDTGLVFYGTYGGTAPVPYGAPDPQGTYFLDAFGILSFDENGHAALIRLEPYSGYSCSTCWESLNENVRQNLEIYPNPASTEIQFENLTEPISAIKIISIDGREMYSEKNPDTEKIFISFLQSGTYLILIETEDGLIYSEKFVKL